MPSEVEELRAMVADLARDVATLTHQRAASDVRPWLGIDDPETARLCLADLVDWLGQIWVRYPGQPLPECWYLHPWIVEELWVALGTWRAAQRKGGSWPQLAEWHRTIRPGVAERIHRHAGTCALDQHQPDARLDRPHVQDLPVPPDLDACLLTVTTEP